MSDASIAAGTFPDQIDSIHSVEFPNPAQQSLSQAVYARRAEYTRPHTIRIKVGTWNVAAKSGTEKDIGAWFVGGKGVSSGLSGLNISAEDEPHYTEEAAKGQPDPRESVADQEARRTKKESTVPKNDPGLVPSGEEVDIYALGLQEIVDITSPVEAFRNDPATCQKYKKEIEAFLPNGYALVAEKQLVGLYLLVYASPSLASTITNVSTTSVSTGLIGMFGNKGAVAARLYLGDATRLVFINAHLSAGADKASLDRRNWDAAQIVSRLKFNPVQMGGDEVESSGEGLGEEDFAFWFGDINYRLTGLPGEDVRRILLLHARNEYDIGSGQRSERKMEKELSETDSPIAVRPGSFEDHSSTETPTSPVSTSSGRFSFSSASTTLLPEEIVDPEQDPASLQATISSLLPHDELRQQIARRKAFHDGWREGPITFMPTYKYDVGSVGMFDSSEKRRSPSWCDRILFRTRKDMAASEQKAREEEESRKRDEELKSRGADQTEEADILFDYDPETDGANDDDYDEVTDQEVPEPSIPTEEADDRLRLELYVSHQRVLSSDHKPLDATFSLTYDAVEPLLRAKVHQEVAKELDRAENEARPNLAIVVDKPHSHSTPAPSLDGATDVFEGVDFGLVRFGETITRGATIANTGQATATFSFVDRSVMDQRSKGISPPWLRISFDYNQTTNVDEFKIDPGDTVNLRLELRVDDIDHVQALNEGKEALEDVIVLRVSNGRDHFLALRGHWLQSCFGRSIDELVRVPEGGVRVLEDPHALSIDKPVRWAAPRELFRLTDALEELVERVLAEWEMINIGDTKAPWATNAGWPFSSDSWTTADDTKGDAQKLALREALDTDQSLTSSFSPEIPSIERLEILSEALLAFSSNLKDGIINETLWQELETVVIEREKAKRNLTVEEEHAWILEVLSSHANRNVSFVFVTSMLSRVANELAPTRASDPSSPAPNNADLKLPANVTRPKTLSEDSRIARRQLVDKSFAAIFADVVIKASYPAKEKEKRASEERRRRLVEVFLEANRDHER